MAEQTNIKPQNKKKKRMALPFEERPFDFSTWVYDHRVGLCMMIISYLIAGIIFMSAKVITSRPTQYHSIIIDLTDIPPQPEQKSLSPEELKKFEDQIRDVQNRVSDENAKTEVTPERTRTTVGKDIAQLEDEVSKRVKASRDAYEKGLREEQDMINARNAQKDKGSNEPTKSVKVQGNVSISYSLDGRTATFLHMPAYQCEGGGQVIVAITVNRNGNVTNASINSTSTPDNCLSDRALQSAKASRFNVSANAPEKQSGTITYIFVPQ